MARQNTGYEDKGDVAQLGERHVRNVDVVGSNPIISTRTYQRVTAQAVTLFSRIYLNPLAP